MTISSVGFKSNTIDIDPKVDSVDTTTSSASSTDETVSELDSMFETDTSPTALCATADTYDDFMLGDTVDGVINNNDSGTDLSNFPPTLEDILAANPDARKYTDVIAARYESAIEDLTALRKLIEDTLFKGTVSSSEAAAMQARISQIDVALSRAKTQLELTNQLIESDGNTYTKEKVDGIDYNNDHWIGRPDDEGSYGIQVVDGETIFIDPVTKTALDHPPYPLAQYEPVVAQGNVQIADEITAPPLDDQLTADLTIQITDGTGREDTKFHTAYEVCGVQYFWVKRDGTSFEPEIAYKRELNSDTGLGTEKGYELLGFSQTADGKIVQNTPEDISKYIQVEVCETAIISQPTADGKGYDHFVEYRDKDRNVIARIRITGYTTNEFKSYGRDNGDGTFSVYASSVGLAVNMDNVYSSGTSIDASGMKSTCRHIVGSVEELEQILGIEDKRPDESDDKAYKAYMENLELFGQEDYSMDMYFTSAGHSGVSEEVTRDFSMGGEYDVYIDPDNNAASQLIVDENTVSSNGNRYDISGYEGDYSDAKSNGVKLEGINNGGGYESVADTRTGVMIYGLGARGHIVGADGYNNIIMVADANALYENEYYQDHFSGAKPLDDSSPLYATVVDCGSGNNIVRAYSGDNFIKGATFAWIDGSTNDTNYVMTNGSSEGNSTVTGGNAYYPMNPVNPKNYVHVDAPGGEIAIHNPNEADSADSLINSSPPPDDYSESPWLQSTYDDYYDLNGGKVYFSDTSDRDAIDSIEQGNLSSTNNFMDESDISTEMDNMATAIWEDVTSTKLPDDVDSYVEDWVNTSGVTAEVKEQMDAFFGELFGDQEDLLAEFETAENKANGVTTTTS